MSIWMSQPDKYYDIISMDDPSNILFTKDATVVVYGKDNKQDQIEFKKGEGYKIVGRVNPVTTVNSSGYEYVIQNSDGKYGVITIYTNWTASEHAADYRTLGEYVNGEYAFDFVTQKSTEEGKLSDSDKFTLFVTDTDAKISNAKNEVTNNENTQEVTFTYENTLTAFNESVVYPIISLNESNTKTRMEPTIFSYGLPPQWTKYVDPRVMGFTTGGGEQNDITIQVGLGRRYTAVTISNPTILEIAPGFMKYANWMNEDANFIENINKFKEDPGDNKLASSLIASFDEHSSTFYTIKPCFGDQMYNMGKHNDRAYQFAGYISYVKYLMMIATIFLSRAEAQGENGAGNTTNMDAQYLKFRSNGTREVVAPLSQRKILSTANLGENYAHFDWQNYNKRSGQLTIGGGIVLGYVGGASNVDPSSNAKGEAFDYIKFYLSGSTTATDQFTTDIEDSMLGSLANTLNMAVKDAAYWIDSVAGDVLTTISSTADEIINAVKFDGENLLGGIFNIPEMIGGGKIVFPQIITTSKYGKSIECECTFPAIYGDEEAMLINTLTPYLHLLAFALPHQVKTSLEMYTFPFIVKAFCRGLFNVEMGAITGFNVQRGGSDNALWSFNGAAEIITVSFEITPLINNLVMTSARDGPGWLLKNKGLQEYMSAITAFDARNDQYELAWDILRAGFQETTVSKLQNILTPLLQNETVSSIVNFYRKISDTELSPGKMLNDAVDELQATGDRLLGRSTTPDNPNDDQSADATGAETLNYAVDGM